MLIKLNILPLRRAGISAAECTRYINEVHAPLVLRETSVSGYFRGYRLNNPRHDVADLVFAYPPANPPRDAFTQVYFDDIASMAKSTQEARYIEAIRPDEDCFAQPGSAIVLISSEHELVPGPIEGLKLIALSRHSDSSTPEEFQRAWWAHYLPELEAAARTSGLVRALVHNRVLPPKGPANPFDVFEELWFDDVKAMQAFGREFRKPLLETATRFADLGAAQSYVAQMRVMK